MWPHGMKPLEEQNYIIKFTNVCVELNGITILDNINLQIPCSSWTAIIGPNGAGKTTLLLSMLKQVPYRGEIIISKPDMLQNTKIGYVPQKLSIDRALPITVMEFLTMSRQWMPLWIGKFNPYKERAQFLLRLVGVEHLAERRISELSGGELQRVLLVSALQEEPDLLILDEPTAGIDIKGERIFCELLENLKKQFNFSILMVSHDIGMIMHHASYVILLNKVVIADGAPGEVITQNNLLALFGLHMGIADAQLIRR